MSNSYVASHAILRCSCGSDFTILTVSNSRSVKLCGKPMANIGDNSVLNIHYYGICCAAGSSKVCMPITPNKWEGGKHDCLVQGEPALLKTSVLRCMCGGVITLLDDGQSPLSIEEKLGLFNRMKEIEEQDTSIPWYDNPWLDLAEFIPVLGSILGIVRSYAKGDVKGVMLGFGILAFEILTSGVGGIAAKTVKILVKTKSVTKAARFMGKVYSPLFKKPIKAFKEYWKLPLKEKLIFPAKAIWNKIIKFWNEAKEYCKLPLIEKLKKEAKAMPKAVKDSIDQGYKIYEKRKQDKEEEKKANEMELENMRTLNNAKSRKYKKVKTGAIGIIRIPPKECSAF